MFSKLAWTTSLPTTIALLNKEMGNLGRENLLSFMFLGFLVFMSFASLAYGCGSFFHFYIIGRDGHRYLPTFKTDLISWTMLPSYAAAAAAGALFARVPVFIDACKVIAT